MGEVVSDIEEITRIEKDHQQAIEGGSEEQKIVQDQKEQREARDAVQRSRRKYADSKRRQRPGRSAGRPPLREA